MKLFHNSYKEITNVPVDRAATSVVHDDGNVYILMFNGALFFGNSMDHSIIKPNKIRLFFLTVSNDPFDRTQEFGIYHEELLITFKTEGTTVFFYTYVPSYHELETCSRIVLTDIEV